MMFCKKILFLAACNLHTAWRLMLLHLPCLSFYCLICIRCFNQRYKTSCFLTNGKLKNSKLCNIKIPIHRWGACSRRINPSTESFSLTMLVPQWSCFTQVAMVTNKCSSGGSLFSFHGMSSSSRLELNRLCYMIAFCNYHWTSNFCEWRIYQASFAWNILKRWIQEISLD
jgi:hypothetical protein